MMKVARRSLVAISFRVPVSRLWTQMWVGVVVVVEGFAGAVASGFHAEEEDVFSVGKHCAWLPGGLSGDIEFEVAESCTVGVHHGGSALGGEEESFLGEWDFGRGGSSSRVVIAEPLWHRTGFGIASAPWERRPPICFLRALRYVW